MTNVVKSIQKIMKTLVENTTNSEVWMQSFDKVIAEIDEKEIKILSKYFATVRKTNSFDINIDGFCMDHNVSDAKSITKAIIALNIVGENKVTSHYNYGEDFYAEVKKLNSAFFSPETRLTESTIQETSYVHVLLLAAYCAELNFISPMWCSNCGFATSTTKIANLSDEIKKFYDERCRFKHDNEVYYVCNECAHYYGDCEMTGPYNFHFAFHTQPLNTHANENTGRIVNHIMRRLYRSKAV